MESLVGNAPGLSTPLIFGLKAEPYQEEAWCALHSRSHVNVLLQYIVPQYMGCHRSGTHCACHRAIQALTTSLGFHVYHCLLLPTNIGYCQPPKIDHSQPFSSSTLGHYLQLLQLAFLQRPLLLRRRPTPSFLVQYPRCLRRLFKPLSLEPFRDLLLPSSVLFYTQFSPSNNFYIPLQPPS
jgi:hypothetical protein